MKVKSGLPTIAWVLAGLLALSAAALWLSGPETHTNPSAMSYKATGLKAYSDVLRSLGYDVVVSRAPNPDFGPNDVAVICRLWDFEPG